MNQTKPEPPPKELRPHVRDVDHTCPGKTPCGSPCELNSAHRHRYHTCGKPGCPKCHGAARFGRASA